MPVVRSASTTKEITSVNAMKATRWTLPLRPARPWVSHLSHTLSNPFTGKDTQFDSIQRALLAQKF